MTRVLVAFVALVLAGCGGPKPPAPASSGPRPEPAPARARCPGDAAGPDARTAPQATAPLNPIPRARRPRRRPAPQVLYVKTHLANFREGAGTSRKILRVLRQGARLQVLETRTTWLRVRLDDGQEGWIAESVTSVTAPVTPPARRSRAARPPRRRG